LGADLTRRRGNPIAIAEFAGPYGVADLLVLHTSAYRLRRRMDAGIPPLVSEIDASIAARATGRGVSLEAIATACLYEPGLVKARLVRLARLGAVRESATGLWSRAPSLCLLGTTHAFEAKIADWRRGLDQARTYSLWADTVTLVLDRLPSDIEPLVEAANDQGTGLALRSSWLLPPRPHQHSDERRFWTSELAASHLLAS
jgi:hypothetical protein